MLSAYCILKQFEKYHIKNKYLIRCQKGTNFQENTCLYFLRTLWVGEAAFDSVCLVTKKPNTIETYKSSEIFFGYGFPFQFIYFL